MPPSKTVIESYSKISKWFDEHRSRDLFEKAWLDKAIAYLKPNASILDLGCGMGEPIAQYFIDRNFQLTGVDGCQELINMAKQRLPSGCFLIGDMRELSLSCKFDLTIAWHSFFHLSQNDQREMFKTFASHLNDGGILLFTSGNEAGEVWSNNGGENLYHASLSPNEYKTLLNQYGFELLDHKTSDPECGDATVWLAKFKPIKKPLP